MFGVQNSIIQPEEVFLPIAAQIELNEKQEIPENKQEVIFIRRKFDPPSLLEIRFARLKKAMRNRSAGII